MPGDPISAPLRRVPNTRVPLVTTSSLTHNPAAAGAPLTLQSSPSFLWEVGDVSDTPEFEQLSAVSNFFAFPLDILIRMFF